MQFCFGNVRPFPQPDTPVVEIPSGALFHYDASLDVIGTTYANNAVLPNQISGSSYNFKSVVAGVTVPTVATNNSKNGLNLTWGDGVDYYSYIQSVSRITPETQPITFIIIASVAVAGRSWLAALNQSPRGGVNRPYNTNAINLWNYSNNTSYAIASTTALESYLVELPANNETEPKTFKLFRNGANIITTTNSTDFSYTSQNFLIQGLTYNQTGHYLHEFLIWQQRLTAQEIEDVFTIMQTKWGIV